MTKQWGTRLLSCDGKEGHLSYTAAERAMPKKRGKKGGKVNIYKCKFCGKFHIGSNFKAVSTKI
jgi:hypothetical protein